MERESTRSSRPLALADCDLEIEEVSQNVYHVKVDRRGRLMAAYRGAFKADFPNVRFAHNFSGGDFHFTGVSADGSQKLEIEAVPAMGNGKTLDIQNAVVDPNSEYYNVDAGRICTFGRSWKDI